MTNLGAHEWYIEFFFPRGKEPRELTPHGHLNDQVLVLALDLLDKAVEVGLVEERGAHQTIQIPEEENNSWPDDIPYHIFLTQENIFCLCYFF